MTFCLLVNYRSKIYLNSLIGASDTVDICFSIHQTRLVEDEREIEVYLRGDEKNVTFRLR